MREYETDERDHATGQAEQVDRRLGVQADERGQLEQVQAFLEGAVGEDAVRREDSRVAVES